ncbi:hypothetical protein BHM03_00006055 [Ensete ventricosum]|nr:hypothetical protein BHM03_00006055 [Ensete ventricosum]
MDQPGHATPPLMGVAAGVPYAGGGPYQAYQHLFHQQQQQQQQQLQLFWADQYREIEQTTDFKNHSLPLARIKKIMKADEDRRTLQKNDIAAAISRTDVFDFLIDIVPREEEKEDVARPLGAPPTDPMSYYYVQHSINYVLFDKTNPKDLLVMWPVLVMGCVAQHCPIQVCAMSSTVKFNYGFEQSQLWFVSC